MAQLAAPAPPQAIAAQAPGAERVEVRVSQPELVTTQVTVVMSLALDLIQTKRQRQASY